MRETLSLFLTKNKYYLLGLYTIAVAWSALQIHSPGYSSSVHRLVGFTLAAFFLLKWNQRDCRPGEVSFLTTLIPTQRGLLSIHLLVPAAMVYLPVGILSSDTGLTLDGLLLGIPLALILACISNLATKPLTQVLSFGLVYLILLDSDGEGMTFASIVATILLYKAILELLALRISRRSMRIALASALAMILALSISHDNLTANSSKSTVNVDGRTKTKNNFSIDTGNTNFKFNVNSDIEQDAQDALPLTPEELATSESILQVFRNKAVSDYQETLESLAVSDQVLTDELVTKLEDLILIENPNLSESESACQEACQELAKITVSQWGGQPPEVLKERYQRWLRAPSKIHSEYVLNVAIFAKLKRHQGNWNEKPASQFFDSITEEFLKIKETLSGDKDYLRLAEEELNLTHSN